MVQNDIIQFGIEDRLRSTKSVKPEFVSRLGDSSTQNKIVSVIPPNKDNLFLQGQSRLIYSDTHAPAHTQTHHRFLLIKFCSRRAHRLSPVSYTHLDVYKRQSLLRSN